MQMKLENKFFVLPPHKIVSGGSYVPSSYSTNPMFKNRHALPTIPMQSTFKSLLSIPINNVTNPNKITSNNFTTTTSTGAKVYYRPQDLSSSNRQTNNNNNSTNKSNESEIDNLNAINEKLKNELYLLQKNSTDRLYNGLPSATTPVISTNKRISTRKLVINTSPTISNRNGSLENDRSRSMSPVEVNNKSPNGLNGHTTNGIKNSSPPPVNPRHNVPVTVTPINITSQNDANLDANNNIVNNKTTNYIATKTSITTTTTTTEQLNSIVRRTPTPTNTNLNGYQPPLTPTSNLVNDEPVLNANLNSNHKLRSWSGTVNTNRLTNENSIFNSNGNNNNKLFMERTSTPEHFQHGHLTNWKSTAATSSQSDKQILIDHVSSMNNANEIKIQPRESFQYNANNVGFDLI